MGVNGEAEAFYYLNNVPAIQGRYELTSLHVLVANHPMSITYKGRIIYKTTVATVLFRIQNLNTAVSGSLDVKVQEEGGTYHSFQVEMASIPYLTRPDSVRYKLAFGKPSDYGQDSKGPGFATGEFPWGGQ